MYKNHKLTDFISTHKIKIRFICCSTVKKNHNFAYKCFTEIFLNLF